MCAGRGALDGHCRRRDAGRRDDLHGDISQRRRPRWPGEDPHPALVDARTGGAARRRIEPAAAGAAWRPDSDGARAGGRGEAAGRAGRAGARGRGRGAAPAAPLSPTAALAQAIGRAPTIGYLWTADVTGYAIKYAYRAPLPDGGERVILASDRRLGTHSAAWQPTASNLTDYEFTVIEIRFNGKGVGEGKTSLTTKVIVDNEAKTVALENYATAAPILRNVKRS